MYDVIVMGARCAGAPTAMLLARKGYRVLLVDRATFPSDIPHGHFIHRNGPGCLHGGAFWIESSRARAHRSRHSRSMSVTFRWRRTTSVDGVAFGYGPRRSLLDAVLVDAAIEARVELREGFTVQDFVSEGDRVCGIRGRTRTGTASVTERARVTIGADGRRSRLAAAVQAPVYDAFPAVTCWYSRYWTDVVMDSLEVYVLADRVIFAFPTSDSLVAIFVAWSIDGSRRCVGSSNGVHGRS